MCGVYACVCVSVFIFMWVSLIHRLDRRTATSTRWICLSWSLSALPTTNPAGRWCSVVAWPLAITSSSPPPPKTTRRESSFCGSWPKRATGLCKSVNNRDKSGMVVQIAIISGKSQNVSELTVSVSDQIICWVRVRYSLELRLEIHSWFTQWSAMFLWCVHSPVEIPSSDKPVPAEVNQTLLISTTLSALGPSCRQSQAGIKPNVTDLLGKIELEGDTTTWFYLISSSCDGCFTKQGKSNLKLLQLCKCGCLFEC